ncbi:MAG: cyclopropane-fatty-acyl-phospholipid synthase family protein [Gammaproteobacteria bacterium]|nr:cyclopropane-fatty-acyl-phospholipid synthase family protein [Gammaproteobacteria bacterium]
MPYDTSLALKLPILARLPWHQRRLVDHLARLRRGRLAVQLGGHAFVLHGRDDGPAADIAIARPAALLRKLIWRGDLGFAESFIAGDWQTGDLAGLLELLAINLDAYAATERRSALTQATANVRHWLNRNTRGGSRRNIAAHYDLGNDFYMQWLDWSMTYSAALFDAARADESLADAQQRKYARMLELVDPAPGETILEIGCGWGGFAEYAATRGYNVVGLTLSREQLAYAQQRVRRAGLAERVDLRLCDYRDFDERVDHVVSIEMFEAVGREYWQGYFDSVARCLRPGGRAALQVITIDEGHFDAYAANPGGFIQTYIFPGGMLPTKTHLGELAAAAGLGERGLDGFGDDYATTLAHWHRQFDACGDWLERNGYDEPFRRMWRYYLAFCEAGFRARLIDVVHCALVKR